MVVKNPITGNYQKNCGIYNCKFVAHKAFGGIVFCRKHYKKDLIKIYGSLEKASKYVKA